MFRKFRSAEQQTVSCKRGFQTKRDRKLSTDMVDHRPGNIEQTHPRDRQLWARGKLCQVTAASLSKLGKLEKTDQGKTVSNGVIDKTDRISSDGEK